MDLYSDIQEICRLFSNYSPRSLREKNLIDLFFKADHDDLRIISYITTPLLEELSDNSLADIEVPESHFDGQGQNTGEQGGIRYHWSQKQDFVKRQKNGFSYYISDDGANMTLQSDMGEIKEVPEHELMTAEEWNEAPQEDLALGRSLPAIDLSQWPDLIVGDGKKVLGVDVAQLGSHKTSICMRWGNIVCDIQTFTKTTSIETAEHVMRAIRHYEPDEVCVDSTGGWGAAVIDQLIAMGADQLTTITGIHFNAAPREDRLNAFNARSEMYLLLAEKLEKGEVVLPPHKNLIDGMVSIKYVFVAEDKIKLLPKDKTMKDFGRSPDESDSLALAFYSQGGLEIY